MMGGNRHPERLEMGRSDPKGKDNDRLEQAVRLPIRFVQRAGDVLQLLIGMLLLVIAGVVLFRTGSDLITNSGQFALRITDAINQRRAVRRDHPGAAGDGHVSL